MEEIVAFITKNFFFVILVVGFIFSLFSKKRKINQNPRMPDFGGGGLAGTGRPSKPAEQRRERETPEPLYTSSAEGESLEQPAQQEVYRTAMAVQDKRERRPERSRLLAANESGDAFPQPEAPARTPSDPLRLRDRDELARAVVLAEILGPPRARKPLRRG